MIYSRRWNPSPITAEENTYLPACGVEDKPRAGCVHKHTEHPSLLQPVCGNFSDEIFVSGGASCGYCSTLSAPHPMSSCCSIQPLSLLAWLPATPESFQQTPLSASWIKQPPTSKTMAAFCRVSLCFIKTNHAALWGVAGCKSMQTQPVWKELKPLYLQMTIKACGSWSNIQQMTSCEAWSGGSSPKNARWRLFLSLSFFFNSQLFCASHSFRTSLLHFAFSVFWWRFLVWPSKYGQLQNPIKTKPLILCLRLWFVRSRGLLKNENNNISDLQMHFNVKYLHAAGSSFSMRTVKPS